MNTDKLAETIADDMLTLSTECLSADEIHADIKKMVLGHLTARSTNYECSDCRELITDRQDGPWELCTSCYHATARPTNEAIAEALVPFAQVGFSRVLAGNVEGDKSIIFERDGCKLRLGDFKRAAVVLDKVRPG